MSLSNSHDNSSKADQIAHKFFSKFAHLLHNARATPHQPQARVDKWFNLETPDTDQYRDHLRLYRSLSVSAPLLPPFELQVLLSVPELATNQVLVFSDATATRARVEPTPSHVLLESWVVVFSPGRPYDGDDRQDVALSSVYKQSISVFRSMFTLLRVLPAWKLFRRLRRPEASNLAIHVRVADHTSEDRVLKFGTPLSTSVPSLPTSSHVFPPVAHPLGTLTISTTYLLSPLFQIDTLESLLSSRFLSQDDESFTPTLTARQQNSLSGSPVMRASLPRSPPGPSLADRFVLPANTSAHSSPLRAPPASLSRATSGSGSRHSGSGGSASRPVSLMGALPPGSDSPASSGSPKSGLHALPEAAAMSPSPGPLPIRRPSINTIHPFKSATLSSGGSPSLHSHSGVSSSLRHSPLSGSAGGPSLPSRPPLSSSPSARPPLSSSPSPRTQLSPTYPPPPSPMSIRHPGTQRPSPPSDRPPQGKRYSSSFGHRYATSSGAGSDGSPGKRADEKDRPASASFLSTTTDDDEISAFVQAIDARAPLSTKRGALREPSGDTEKCPLEWRKGQRRLESGAQGKLGAETEDLGNEDVPRPDGETEVPRIGIEPASQLGSVMEMEGAAGFAQEGSEGGVAWESGDGAAAMAQEEREAGASQPRKYRDHVDAELKRMNDVFALSLVGLESRPRRHHGTGRTAHEADTRTASSSGGDSSRASRPNSFANSPRSPSSIHPPRGSLPGSPRSADRGIRPDSPAHIARGGGHPDSPSRAEYTTRLPDSPARGSPLRPTLTLFASGSGSPSASGSASGSAAEAVQHRIGSMASGSDEIIGRLEFDEPGRPEGHGAGYARPYPYR